MVIILELPGEIASKLTKKFGIQDNIGMSGAYVYLFDDMVLKVQPSSVESDNEVEMMRWLYHKLPVPQVIEHIKTNKLSYLLMSRCKGEYACADTMMANPRRLSESLAKAIHQIWDVDIQNCPVNQSLEQKLIAAENNVINGLVDVDNCEPDTFGAKGFKNPETLLYWLQTNRPNEEFVLSHGDMCLPNIFFCDNLLSGLIDLGRSGISDKWCDVAICYRSLKHNFDGVYSGIKLNGFQETYFFDALQLKPDWDRIRYYLLLDELF